MIILACFVRHFVHLAKRAFGKLGFTGCQAIQLWPTYLLKILKYPHFAILLLNRLIRVRLVVYNLIRAIAIAVSFVRAFCVL